ncbi:hypothetical protein [Streptomyces sioyaensis]|uniref:ATP-binding protein n=1 Tax=Streptomyces sioyaensis TaxID=67364 RepID=UPI0037A8895B
MISPLTQAGAEVVVLGFADLSSCFGTDITCGNLPPDLTDEALETLLRGYKADLAIPNMNSPGQEQMLPTYARFGPRWQAARGKLPVHSEEFALLATDKVAFHRTAQQRNWPVPRGELCENPRALMTAVDTIGLPVIVKEARSESHAGRYVVRDRESLPQVSHGVGGITYPVLAQQLVTGHEYAVELLTLPSHTISWPVASLGPLDSNCAPGKRARVEPALLPDRAQEALISVVQDIVDTYRPLGPWQMDFAVSDDSGLQVIELNGRFGGLSNMSWASTGDDPHLAHIHAVLGRPVEQPRPARVALELPVHNDAELPPPPAGLGLASFVGSPTNQVPLTAGYYRAVLSVPDGREREARDWLHRLPPGCLLIGPDEATAQLTRGFHALGQGTAPAF